MLTHSLSHPGRGRTVAALVAMSVAIGAFAPSVDAASPKNKLVSRNSTGDVGDEGSSSAALSKTGRYVAFESRAKNLAGGDLDSTADVFVRDMKKRKTRLVSKSSGGVAGDDDSSRPAISADGRFVAFESKADNLGGGSSAHTQIFVRDTHKGKTRLVSRSSKGTRGDGPSFLATISANGRYVAFSSDAKNLVGTDKNGHTDVFVHDRWTGKTRIVSKRSTGKRGNGSSGSARISANGRHVIFDSAAKNLVKNDTNGSLTDVFVHDRKTGKTNLVSRKSNGKQGNGHSYWPAISGNGRYVAFISDVKNLVKNDMNSVDDVFVRDRKTGKTRRVNVRSNGDEANLATIRPPAISGDGRIIAFESVATTLLKNDPNGNLDVFYHDRVTRKTRLANYSRTGKHSSGAASTPALSTDGRFIGFASHAENLVGSDGNGEEDVFRRGPIR